MVELRRAHRLTRFFWTAFLLLTAVTVLWFRSIYRTDVWGTQPGCTVIFTDGEIVIRWFPDGPVQGDVVKSRGITFIGTGFYTLVHELNRSFSVVFSYILFLPLLIVTCVLIQIRIAQLRRTFAKLDNLRP